MREEELTFTVEEEEGQLCLDQVGREYGMALFSAGVCKVKLPPGSIPRKEAQAAAQVVEKKVDDIRERKWDLVKLLKDLGHDFTATTEGMDVVLSAPPSMKWS